MENIEEEEEVQHHSIPSSKATKSMSKIVNTRFLNQNIYTTFLQKVLPLIASAMANASISFNAVAAWINLNSISAH